MKVAAIAAIFAASLVFGLVYFAQAKLGGKGLGTFPIGSTLIEVVTFPLNVILFFIGIVSLVVAIAAFREAQEGGKQQQEALDASRKALEQVVVTARTQQELMERSLKTSMEQHKLLEASVNVTGEHLALYQQQVEAEKKRLAQKPKFVFELQQGLNEQRLATETCDVTLGVDHTFGLDLHIKNVGDATALDPNLLIVASSKAVEVRPTKGGNPSLESFILIMPPSALGPIEPHHLSNLERLVEVKVDPKTERSFTLTIKLSGSNFKAHEVVMRVNVPQ